MNRLDTFELELNKAETRLLHNIIREWLDNHPTENEVVWDTAADLAAELYNAWKGER